MLLSCCASTLHKGPREYVCTERRLSEGDAKLLQNFFAKEQDAARQTHPSPSYDLNTGTACQTMQVTKRTAKSLQFSLQTGPLCDAMLSTWSLGSSRLVGPWSCAEKMCSTRPLLHVLQEHIHGPLSFFGLQGNCSPSVSS